MSNKVETSLIIPIHILNNELLEMTQRCLLSLDQQKPDEVIIVDGCSPIEFNQDYFTRLVNARIWRLDTDLGYTHAVNVGLKAARGDILIVGNNDLIFSANWLEAIQKPLREGYDIASIQVVDDGTEAQDRTDISEGDKFGCLFAFTRKLYDQIGGLDEGISRGPFTDLDFQKRAEDAGFKHGKNWAEQMIHYSRSTMKLVDPKEKEYLRAMKNFKKKWGSVW